MLFSRRNFCLLLVICLILIFSTGITFAALPDLSSPLEPRFYEGAVDKIIAFMKERDKEIQALKVELQEIISKTTNEQEKRVLSDALDFFQALTIKYMKLQSQLKAPVGIVFKVPSIGSPPYTLDTFCELCDLMGKIKKELSENEPKIRLYESDLSTIEDDLKSLLSDYIVLKRATPPKPEAYLRLGQIYSQQVKYAIYQLKLVRAKKIVDEATKLRANLRDLLKTVFNGLKITNDDIAKAKEAYQKFSSQMNKQLELLGKQAVALNKKIIPYEVKLNKTLAKIKTTKRGDSNFPILQARKTYYEALIETSQLKLENVNQQKFRWKLKSLRAQFRYDWISSYAETKGSKSVKAFLREWYSMLDDIRNLEEALKQQLVDIRSREFELMRKLTAISDKRSLSTDPALLRALSAAHSKLKEANNAIDDLFVMVSKNRELASSLERKVSLVLDLIRKRAGLAANVEAWSRRNLTKTWEDIKAVLYYPLLTIGDSAITLSSILKVILLLTIGIYLLRKGRKKLNNILIKKTQLAPGTIGSVTTLIYYSFLVLVVLIALSTAGINMNQLSIILGGLGVGIGFGLQTIANNFISGLILLIDRSIKVGDFVQLEDGLIGEVKNVAIRCAVVRTHDGEDIIVPNSEFVSQRVRNWTYGDNWRRIKIPFGVSYDADPDEVAKIAIEAAREVPTTVEDYRHPIRVRFEGFGDNSLNFFLKVWCRMTELRGDHGYMSDYYFVLFKKFKEAGIEIPFPQRDINIKHVSPDILKELSK